MAERLADRLVRSLDRSLDHVSLRQQASELVRPAVGFDLAVWATVDPATVMWTSCVLDGAATVTTLVRRTVTNVRTVDCIVIGGVTGYARASEVRTRT